MDGAAVDLLRLVRQGQGQTPVNQTAEQQVKVGAVIFDIGFQSGKHSLIVVIGRVVDVLHVGVVQLEDTETNVEVLCGHGVFGLDLVSGAANALFADFADGLVSCFVGFRLRSDFFLNLYGYILSFPSIFFINPHYSLRCSRGT